MAEKDLTGQYDACTFGEKAIVALLAINGESLGKTRLLEHVQKASIKDNSGKTYTAASLAETMARLRFRGVVTEAQGSGLACPDALVNMAIRNAIAEEVFDALCNAIESINKIQVLYGHAYARTYGMALARLRMALLRGQPPQQVAPWLEACFQFFSRARPHPYIEICARPFEPDLFARIHPALQDEIAAILLTVAVEEPDSAPAVRAWAEHRCAQAAEPRQGPISLLVFALSDHWLLCGRLDDAWHLLEGNERATALFLRSSILLLRGDHATAASGFEAALKALRKETGKRNVRAFGICGYLYVLAMLRSADPKMRKHAETYLALVLRSQYGEYDPVFRQLHMLFQVQAGILKAEAVSGDGDADTDLLTQMFQALIAYWLGLPLSEKKKARLEALYRRMDNAGMHFIAAQAAGLLGHMGDAALAERAAALRAQYGFTDLADWFERQEQWQRQLTALINLRQAPAAAGKAEAQARLAWFLSFGRDDGVTGIEPREQKRDARGNWTRGRPVALKRLREEPEQIDYLTQQDLKVASAIYAVANYYGGARYEIDADKAMAALVGHPLVFREDTPGVRVELLPGEPQLSITERAGKLKLDMQPPFDDARGNVLAIKETPTRLRVFNISDEHRRVAAIVGNGLNVPAHAKEQVLHAIAAISSLVTVQSGIGGGAANVEQVAADTRLHVHLLPYQSGLKMQILVRPLAKGGPYFTPGHGAESVIAEIGGKPLQARRDLAMENRAQQQLIAACPMLSDAEQVHGEWLLDEPQNCLELLLQLQVQEDKVLLAWPEGEKFKVGAQAGGKQFRLSIKSEKDWFAAGGELQIDENKVLDLRQLLDLLQHSQGRFVPLGGNEFLALTEEFHRRLSELAAFSESHGKGARIHPLATFALEDLADDTGTLKADKTWKQHLERLHELDAFEPQLPGTLQAELRDYQIAGFRWLARLAHWGVGACLADDMGLGKTLQALALILTRAPQGPTLVVAPTSVCMNWMSEAARFAPTLNVVLFGAGDRKETLAALQPFDLVVASYGLLQQEAELFAGIQWRTIVLDEAQAIKNAQTKRSQAVMALSGEFRMIATGTPLENHLGELWNLFRFINPGLLGSLEQFNRRFAGPIERLQDPAARGRLRRLVQPFILRRIKSQVLSELPPRTEIVLQIDLSGEERALYESLRRSALERLAAIDAPDQQKQLQILAEIMKLRRACCNPQLVAPELNLASSKLAAFAELLDELLENRHKVLVFSQFVDHLSLIRAHLDARSVRYQYLDGATPMQERKTRVDAFQSGDGDVFLISLKAGGMGINLTAADYVIHMDPWWNPAVEDQASDRAHRMGQQRPVTIYRLVARHTIEETIVDLHKHKRDLADSLLEGSDMAARMSAGEMMGMLQERLKS